MENNMSLNFESLLLLVKFGIEDLRRNALSKIISSNCFMVILSTSKQYILVEFAFYEMKSHIWRNMEVFCSEVLHKYSSKSQENN